MFSLYTSFIDGTSWGAANARRIGSLPGNWNYLGWVMVLVVILCALMFAAGWGLARLLKADNAQKLALMYGLGMNNNGTGLVLAGTVLASHSEVLLPLILYNLVQHLAAGCVKSAARLTSAPLPSRDSS
jgi:BASS family bile acid:Na+ symporter